MSTAPSPAELAWRIGWLAGTAVPRMEGATWAPPEPEPEPEPARLQAPTLAELDPGPPRRTRSLLRESIRVEMDRQAQRVYVAAREEVERQIGTAYRVPPALSTAGPRAMPVRKWFGFYEVETSFPVEGTWITTELVPPPLVWGRRWAESKARRILAQYARGDL